jgi:hypothetical protein
MIRFSKVALILGFFAGTACGAAPDEGDGEASQTAAAVMLRAESRAASDFTALLRHVPPADRLDFTAELDDGVVAIDKCGQAACLCSGEFCADLIAAGYCEDFHCALKEPGYTTGAKPPTNTQSESPQCICIFPDSSN